MSICRTFAPEAASFVERSHLGETVQFDDARAQAVEAIVGIWH